MLISNVYKVLLREIGSQWHVVSDGGVPRRRVDRGPEDSLVSGLVEARERAASEGWLQLGCDQIPDTKLVFNITRRSQVALDILFDTQVTINRAMDQVKYPWINLSFTEPNKVLLDQLSITSAR